ncbi:MAG: NADPH:quinone reductase [Pseudomonadota bacterium]
MRAITYTRFGPADEVLTLTNLPTPSPTPGQVLVRLHASGVNPSDVKARAGTRPGVTEPPYPTIIPHSDGAGVIEAVGDGVPSGRIGERVWVWNGQWQRAYGTAADYIALPAAQAVPLPETVSFDTGATLGIPGLTACHTVLGGGAIAGKRVLISGGAGTVGHIAIQIAIASGAEVVATARCAVGLAAAKAAGAHHVLDYTSNTLAEEILTATNGAPIDRAVEVEFGQNADTLAQVMAPNSTIAAYGSAKAMAPTLPFYPMMFKAITLDMVLIYLLPEDQRAKATAALTNLLKRDALTIRIAETHSLANCAAAHEAVATGTKAGSVLVTL